MDPKLMIAMIAVVFVADFGLQFYQRKKRNKTLEKLTDLLAQKDFAAFDELVDAPETRKQFPIYNLNFLKLNEAFLKEDKKQIRKAFESFNGLRMNKLQKEALYKRGFYYFLSEEDKENTRVYYDLLKDLNIRDQETLDVMYDTYILKGYKYLDQIQKQCDEAEGDGKMAFYALLSDMYHNKGDEDKAREYENLIADIGEEIKEKTE